MPEITVMAPFQSLSQSCPCLSHPHSPILVRIGSSTPPNPSSLLLPLDIINRQIHTHPPRRQPDPLLLIHIHPRIIPFHESDIHPLRLQIDSQLLRLVHFLPKRFCSADAVETGG